MKVKTFISTYWQQLVLALCAVAVFCFWLFLYPFVLVMREMAVLFLWNSDYFMERIVLPGGFAQYIGEFIVQFFQNPINGAFAYAVLFLLEQKVASLWLHCFFPNLKSVYRFALSLVLPVVLWKIAMISYIPMTPTIAIILVMGAGYLIMICKKKMKLISTCLLIPVIYWLTGPAAVLLLLCCIRWIPLTATLFAACMIGSSWLTPYPLMNIIKGIDYDWSGEKQMGTYEEMECDMLLRMKEWNQILRKFHNPMSPAVQSAILLATYQTGQIGQEELFRRMIVPSNIPGYEPSVFNLGGMHLIINFGSLVSAFMVSDIALQTNMPNVSQRAAFEAMEYVPNYNKSGRALKRLVETCIITGQYDLAKKYLSILEETFFYRRWAESMRPIVEHPENIKSSPFYQKSQESYANTEDLFFI
ncbi:MAG: hypothetical protein IKZ62_09020 [Prevotella sp.]|nr:hypothetical protein [Prevotella sp.]